MGLLKQDLLYAIRSFIKRPAFTAVAVTTLALGIGLNSAIFSVVNSIILRPLPYKEPDRLVQIWSCDTREPEKNIVVSPADFLDWRKQSHSFEAMCAYNIGLFDLTTAEGTFQIGGAVVTTNFFETIGVPLLLGRMFTEEEEQSNSNHVIIVSYSFWQGRLGGRPDIIGQKLTLNEIPHTIVGVLRPDYRHPEPTWKQTAEIWQPLTLKEGSGRGARYMRAIGRLKQGVTIEQAQAEMTMIASQLAQAYPRYNSYRGVNLVELHKQYTGDFNLAMLVLQGAVGFVLLTACANIANLLLARNIAREKEIAIRLALGASTIRLIRLLLVESLFLAGLGGLIGLLLAFQWVNLLSSFAPRELTRLSDIRLDSRVIGVTLLSLLITTLLFGIAPTWQAAKTNINEALSGNNHAIRGYNVRRLIVAIEIALATVLLIGSGLTLRSIMNLQNVKLGFNPENLLTMQVGCPSSKHGDDFQVAGFYQQVLTRIEALPGVEGAAITSSLPMVGFNDTKTGFTIEGHPIPDTDTKPIAGFRSISPGYFRAMGIPLVKGRAFTEHDTANSPAVVIVNEHFAHRYFLDADPIGRKIIPKIGSESPKEIIGVVADFRHKGLQTTAEPEMYFPHAQNVWSSMSLVVRTSGEPERLMATVQQAIWEVNKSASLAQVRTMKQILSELVSRPRFNLLLLSIFSLVAVILATVGVYGVMSYAVTQKTREIGVRLALGAQPSDVRKLIIWQGAQLTIIGVALGLVAAFGLTRLMSSLLYGISVTDPLTFAGVAVLLSVVALLSCYLPALRASKMDPMVSLRYE